MSFNVNGKPFAQDDPVAHSSRSLHLSEATAHPHVPTHKKLGQVRKRANGIRELQTPSEVIVKTTYEHSSLNIVNCGIVQGYFHVTPIFIARLVKPALGSPLIQFSLGNLPRRSTQFERLNFG
jgi:hypothetical protein